MTVRKHSRQTLPAAGAEKPLQRAPLRVDQIEPIWKAAFGSIAILI
jgi:hypothetical protein